MSSNLTTETSQSPRLLSRIDWPISLFLILNPLFALIATPIYFYYFGFQLDIFAFGLIFAILTNLSITAGYHRLFSHRAYEAHWIVRLGWLLIGASAYQGSCLKWSADHRQHHNKVDSHDDPYSINKGFWYAHMGWLFLKDSTDQDPKAADLQKDWMVQFQHDHYYTIALVTGFLFPLFVGWLMGSAWGGLILAGSLRIALTQQSTFCVNSLTHTFGRRPYSEDISARDSFWVAVITHGEGYHNYHHRFQTDYRNGIKWYQWDPTKWTIRLLAIFGLAQKLRTISAQEILRVRLQLEEQKLAMKGVSKDKLQQLKDRILTAQSTIRALKSDYDQAKKQFGENSREHLRQLNLQIEEKKIELQYSLKLWKNLLRFSTSA